MGTCENGLCCWSPKHQSETQEEQQKQHPTHVSVTVTEQGKEQEQTLVKEFQKKVSSLNENDEGDSKSNGTKCEYPLTPYQESCPHYLRTGYCKFGFNCKFNHPVRRGFQGVKETENGGFVEQPGGQIQCKFYQSAGGCKYGVTCRFNHSVEKSDIPPPELSTFGLPIQLEKKEKKSEGFVEKAGQIECKYHLSAGGCKYGNTCKFSHSNEKSCCRYVKKSEIPPLKLNFLDLPIRMLEKECPFYMRHGSCKYGVDCRFNHPNPVAAGGSDSPNSTTVGVSSGGHSSENCGITHRTAPYLDNQASHAPGMHLNSNWTMHEKSTYSVPAADNLMKTVNFSTYDRREVEEFPERPGQPECDYFMKTGNCRYRSACKFHHPNKNQASKSYLCTPSTNTGLPLRPDKKICRNFEKYGICKYGHSCLFDHSRERSLVRP